ncbi:FMRFamide peptide receptor frpr-18-like [Ylistrum balloti]|uniref:FMRFamide peptide receptor frpr-18-like n=1 Tax=Ylistrum balloti TaxID=509963 RepID=UPI002905AE15|nr:FMRFamide peptide receptor frpr-18-like [Ylistrum balloti]
MNDSACAYDYSVVEDLQGKNITEDDKLKWPCELRTLWVDILPFVTLVRGLLSYGTSIVIILGLIANCLSFIVLTRKHMRKSTTNLYLSVLAVFDSLSLTMNFMIGVLRGQNLTINKDFQDHESLCKFHGVIVELFNLLSVWVILSFTVERFIMIKFPLKAKALTVQRAALAIIGVSSAVFLFSMHKIAVSGFEGDSVFGYKACKTRRAIFPEIIYFYVAFNTWLPTFIIVGLNALIIFEIRKNQIKRKAMTTTSLTKKDEKATKLLLVVSSTYVILILPLGLIQSTELIWNTTAKVNPGYPGYIDYQSTKIKLKWARAFFFFFYQFNFAINFFLYVSSSSATRFQATLRKLFGLKVKEEEMTWMRTQATKSNAIAPNAPSASVVPVES